MSEYSFLIIHGLGGSGPDHWQTWLANELRQKGYHVSYPTFSTYDTPQRDIWLDELSTALQSLPSHHKKIVITHSLGGLLWQHFAALNPDRAADHAIIVAPPTPTTIIPAAKSFFPVPLCKNNLTKAAGETLFVHSTNDPYCSMEDTNHYLKLGFPSISLPNMGHINAQSGHGKWPWILDLCEEIIKKNLVFS